uniref:leucine-rich repeat domain-containing protein n=1 Tax=Alistipes sp. TaxID=1872444 RepID=UPI004057BE4C
MKKLYIFALVATMFVACATDETQDVAVNFEAPDTITVSFEGSDDTRIQLNEAQKTVWTKGDLVSVFYKSNANRKWQYQGETGERTGELKQIAMGSATAAMDKVVVAYPYSKNYLLNLTTGDIEATLPATQHYLSDSYGLDGNLMVSSGYFTQFSLKTVCGWLKVQLTGNGERVRSIKLKGNNGEQVAGLIYVDTTTAACTLASEMGAVGEDGDGVVGGAGGNLAFDGADVKVVTLDCGDGVTLSSEPTAFYIALPPQTFSKGVTVELLCYNGYMTKSTNNSITIERNHIQPMAAVECEGALSIPTNEIWYTSSSGKIVTPYRTDVFGANIVSNTYKNGMGVITFDAPVTSIGYEAFYYCTSLTSVTIPDSVTKIGEYAFYDCTSLKEVYCKPTTRPTGGVYMFSYYDYNNLDYKPIGCTIYVPAASVEAYKAAEYWRDYASDVIGCNNLDPSYTLDAPELEVTAYESTSPWKVKFNIKNANPSIPVEKVIWVANYAREFDVYMSAFGYTYTDMVMMNNGVTNLNDTALQMVNSDFGYDLEFDVLAGSTSRLAAMGWNSESRPSDPDKEGAKAWADATSLEEPNADPLDMTKLNALKGDWTATATVKTVDYNTGLATESQRSWKVSIGGLNENATLTAEEIEYLAGFGVTEVEAKAYLAEFNEMSVEYNAKVLGQNRVLCLGWQIDDTRELRTASPLDLFLMPDYNASQVDYLFNDFGPKWFLQTDAEGNIFIPVNYDRVPQLTRWYNGLSHYLCGGNYEKAIANYISMVDPESVQLAGIPVEISADGNTMTLKSYTVKGSNNEDVDLYPNVLYGNNGGLYFYNAYIVSEVVLTKGWTEPAAPAKLSTRNLGKVNGGKRVANDAEYKAPAKTASRTVFAPLR